MATRIVATGETREKLTTEDYLALVDGGAYRFPEEIKRQVRAGDPAARFAVYGTALRRGLIERVR